MDIEYSCSNAYFKYMLISIKSVVKNSYDERLHFHIFYEDFTEDNLRLLEKFFNENKVKYNLYNIFLYDDLIKKVFSHGVKLAYVKIIMSKIITAKKILHLGADTIVLRSLKPLFELDIDDYYVAGVQDTILWHDRKKVELEKQDYYICSDVTLHNLEKQREENVYDRFVECLRHFNNHVTYCEQGMMNNVFKNKIKILDLKYCVMPPVLCFSSEQIKKIYHLKWFYSQKEIKTVKKDAVIIHFTNGVLGKPWFKKCRNPFKKEFYKYCEGITKIQILEGDGFNKKNKLAAKIYRNFPFVVYLIYMRTVELYRKIVNKER